MEGNSTYTELEGKHVKNVMPYYCNQALFPNRGTETIRELRGHFKIITVFSRILSNDRILV